MHPFARTTDLVGPVDCGPSLLAAGRRAATPVLRLPGVYRPQEDTWLLAAVLGRRPLPRTTRVLDFCTGSGALALTAATLGAAGVTAVDVSARAVLSARANGMLRGLHIRVRRGGMGVALAGGPYDLVLANPPYVPDPGARAPGPTLPFRSISWDAGADGREVLEPLCAHARQLLRPGGRLLLVQSEFADPGSTLAALRESGLHAVVSASVDIPYGPVLRSRAGYLAARGLTAPGQVTERLVVIRGDRPC